MARGHTMRFDNGESSGQFLVESSLLQGGVVSPFLLNNPFAAVILVALMRFESENVVDALMCLRKKIGAADNNGRKFTKSAVVGIVASEASPLLTPQ